MKVADLTAHFDGVDESELIQFKDYLEGRTPARRTTKENDGSTTVHARKMGGAVPGAVSSGFTIPDWAKALFLKLLEEYLSKKKKTSPAETQEEANGGE